MRKLWIGMMTVSVIGAAIEWIELHNYAEPESVPLVVQAFGWPGAILSIPIYLLAGGVHGGGADVWAYSLVPLNAVGYGLIGYIIYRLRRRFTKAYPGSIGGS